MRIVLEDGSGFLLLDGEDGYLLLDGNFADVALPALSVVAIGLTGTVAEIALSVSLVLEGQVTQTLPKIYRGIIINLFNQGLSVYEAYNFNSACRFGGKYLSANHEGIHLLGDERDAGSPIDTEIRSGITDMETNFLKRVTDAYLGLKAEGAYEFRTISDENTEKAYAIVDDDTAPHLKKRDLGKGIKSKYWGFGFRNIDGADFELQSVRLIPQMGNRRK